MHLENNNIPWPPHTLVTTWTEEMFICKFRHYYRIMLVHKKQPNSVVMKIWLCMCK